MATGDFFPSADRELAALEAALGAQYEILRQLGRGGMGAVYLARERLLERLVAIKVLHAERADAESHERFLREARAAARLTHPNIVPLYSFGQSGETVFYVMGYVEGESLEALLRRNGRLPAEESARILGELAGALDFAHRNGVVHRDVKPDNVMIEQGTGRVVLTDFGIARLESGVALTQTGVIVGTPQYMSPEQAAGDRTIDGRSDLYSLGLIGYRMIAGRLPFEGATVREVMSQHVTRKPPALSALAPDAPAAVSIAIMRCLEKAPEERWSTGGDLRSSLGVDAQNELPLPDGLEHHASLGVMILGLAYGAGLAGEAVYGSTRDPWWLVFGGLAAPLISLTILPALFEERRAGLTLRQAARILFAAPSKWTSWWPSTLRRPGDVWDRLPREIRRARAMVGIANALVIGSLVIFVPVIIRGLTSPDPIAAIHVLAVATGTLFAAFGFPVVASIMARRWAAAHGFAGKLWRRLLTEPSWGSKFWTRPEMAVCLGPSTTRALPDAPASSVAIVAAIHDLVGDLDRLDPALAKEVRTAAQDLADVIRNFDRELAELAEHLDPAEADRLAQRVEALGPARADEGDAARQMRRVLADQLALMNDLSRRHAALDERRSQALARLRTLWLHLQGLRARRVLEDADAREITARIRTACANVAHLNAAFDEVQRLTHRPATTPVP